MTRKSNFQEINISHRKGKGKSSTQICQTSGGYVILSWRVYSFWAFWRKNHAHLAWPSSFWYQNPVTGEAQRIPEITSVLFLRTQHSRWEAWNKKGSTGWWLSFNPSEKNMQKSNWNSSSPNFRGEISKNIWNLPPPSQLFFLGGTKKLQLSHSSWVSFFMIHRWYNFMIRNHHPPVISAWTPHSYRNPVVQRMLLKTLGAALHAMWPFFLF